jgi:hypothetical protein
MSEHITAYPLCWPDGWKRTRFPERSRFGKWNKPISIARATNELLHELKLMGYPDSKVIISTNLKLRKGDGLPMSSQREPDDKGVSVWFGSGDKQRVIALDKYDRIADNLWAVAKTIEAMRGIERWGSGEILERTFTGFNALPGPDSVSARSWRDVLDYFGNDIHEANAAYKKARSRCHPDNGGSADEFYAINKAWAQAEMEILGVSRD